MSRMTLPVDIKVSTAYTYAQLGVFRYVFQFKKTEIEPILIRR